MKGRTAPRFAPSPWPWFVAAALVLIFAAGLWALGPQFIFGEGHAERPLWTFLIFYAAGWCGLVLATTLLVRGNVPPMAIILGVTMVARGLLLDSNLIQSNDSYRYVLDGETVLHGVNPYRYPPGQIAESAPETFRTALASSDAQPVLARVTYPDVPTIYPPLAQVAFAAGAWLTPWNWFGQRIVFMVCDIATIVLLLSLLTRFHLSRAWVLLYAWNPLILKEIVNSAHVDSLAAVCLIAAIYAAARSTDAPTLRWPLLCGIALAGAVLAKLYPALLGPVIAAFCFRQHGLRAAAAFCIAFGVGVVALYLPFLGVGADALTEGFRRYAGEWRRNDGAFAILAALTPHARAAYAVIVAAGACTGAWYVLRRDPSIAGLIATLQFVLLGWFLLLPAPYPWYATALIAVCVLRPQFWAVVLSGALAMYYYSFIHEYRSHPTNVLYLSHAIEHGAIWLSIAVSLLVSKAYPNGALGPLVASDP